MGKQDKTNVMRVLDQKKTTYKSHNYEETRLTNGVEIAKYLGQNENQVFKTLVTIGKSKQHYVFVIPVAEALDLKKAAKVSGEKSIDMIPQKDLLPLTGYIHGGCSPIGMKKFFPTFVHETAKSFDTIIFSGGKVGFQVEITPADMEKVIHMTYADIIVEE